MLIPFVLKGREGTNQRHTTYLVDDVNTKGGEGTQSQKQISFPGSCLSRFLEQKREDPGAWVKRHQIQWRNSVKSRSYTARKLILRKLCCVFT